MKISTKGLYGTLAVLDLSIHHAAGHVHKADIAARRGIPEQVTRDFVLGHINVNLGILFKYINADFSDGAKLAVQRAKQSIFQPDWKKVFEPENVLNEVKAITQSRSAAR